MIGTISTRLEDYNVSFHNGFLPDDIPLKLLPESYYQPWETIMGKLPELLRTYQLRQEVDRIPILSTTHLKTEREWQRAYVLLCFMTHGYIWGGEKPSEILPPAISRPFLEVSAHLELPPTATYAGLNLWNFATSIPREIDDWTRLEELTSLHTFTGTTDEAWFYLVSVAMEARCASIIPVILNAISAVSLNDSRTVINSLQALADCAEDLGVILNRMYERCDQDVFYHKIRPYLAGSKGMAAAGLPKGVFYDVGEGEGEWRQYNGGSNAQSSLIQFLDAALGVEHQSTGETRPHGTSKSKQGFLLEMREYMPGPHRRFLEHIASTTNIRSYVLHQPADHPVVHAFNAAVHSLTRFRDTHIVLVTRYIVMPSRKPLAETKPSKLNLAVSSTLLQSSNNGSNNAKMEALTGTGGTKLIPFLKQSRDETQATARFE